MKPFGVLAFLVACGGSSGPSTANFVGSWSVTESLTINCPGSAPQSGNTSLTLGLGNGSGADLQASSTDGCTYKWSVNPAGTEASLTNAPVTCSTTINGTALQMTITSYTLDSSDGHHITTSVGGTVSSQGSSCALAGTGSGTK